MDEKLLLAFEAPLRWLIVVLGIYFSAHYFLENPLYEAKLLHLLRTALIFLVGWGLFRLADESSTLFTRLHLASNGKVDKILIPFLSKLTQFIVAALTITILLEEWGFNVSGFVAGLGLGGLAFALAAKDSLSNLLGGVVIIIERPFSIGDWIQSGTIEGTVEDITFRSTKIRTFAQAVITVPNSELANSPITNWSQMGKRRVTFNLGVSYDTSRVAMQEVVEEIRAVLTEHEGIHPDTISVFFDAYGASSLDIKITFFTKSTALAEHSQVKEEINFKIMEILEKHHVSCAFPSTSIYFENGLRVIGTTPAEEAKSNH